jgi:hypothetical protein
VLSALATVMSRKHHSVLPTVTRRHGRRRTKCWQNWFNTSHHDRLIYPSSRSKIEHLAHVSGIDKILIAMAWSTSSNVFNVPTNAMEAFLRGRTLRYDPITPPGIDVKDNTSQREFDFPYHSVVQKVKDSGIYGMQLDSTSRTGISPLASGQTCLTISDDPSTSVSRMLHSRLLFHIGDMAASS